MNESSDNDTNEMLGHGAKEKADKGSSENQNTSENVEASMKAGTREAPIDPQVLFFD